MTDPSILFVWLMFDPIGLCTYYVGVGAFMFIGSLVLDR